jgi:DNA-binding response OmpR family regulator
MPVQVLLIEHSSPVARALRQRLEDKGINVTIAADAQEGYCRAWQGCCDVIVLDLMLPRQSSLPLIERLRKSGLNLPILGLAPPRSTQDRILSLNRGADDCLARPFDFKELLVRLAALVRRRSRIKELVLHISDLEIDLCKRMVKRAGRPLDLTPREFALLELLARNRGSIVTRAMIRHHLYGSTDRNSSNVVDVFVRYLRSKVDKGSKTPLIVTQYGKGYMLRAEEVPSETRERGG